MRTKLAVIFLVMVAVGAGAYIVLRAGFFPVVFVNGEFVSRSRYETQLNAAIKYTEARAERDPAANEVSPAAVRLELRRAVLDKLVEDALVGRAARVELGKAFNVEVDRKLASVQANLESTDFDEAVETLYGLNVAQFREFVLEPQAWRELLEDALKKEARTFPSWIEEARRAASVRILLRGLTWDGVQVAHAAKK